VAQGKKDLCQICLIPPGVMEMEVGGEEQEVWGCLSGVASWRKRTQAKTFLRPLEL